MVLSSANWAQTTTKSTIKRNLLFLATKNSIKILWVISARHWNKGPALCNLMCESFSWGLWQRKPNYFWVRTKVPRGLNSISRCSGFVGLLFDDLREVVFTLHKLFEVLVGLGMLLFFNERLRYFISRQGLIFLCVSRLNLNVSLGVNRKNSLLRFFDGYSVAIVGLQAFLLFSRRLIDNFDLVWTSRCLGLYFDHTGCRQLVRAKIRKVCL